MNEQDDGEQHDDRGRRPAGDDPRLGRRVQSYVPDTGEVGARILVPSLGLLIVTGLIVALLINGPGVAAKRGDSLWSMGLLVAGLALAYPFLIPLFLASLRDRTRRYQLHEQGLLVGQGDESYPLPWADVGQIFEETRAVKVIGITASSTDLCLRLVPKDGPEVTLDNFIADYASLTPVVAEAVVGRLRKQAKALLRQDREVPFGCLFVGPRGMRVEAPDSKPFPANVSALFSRTKEVTIPQTVAWDDGPTVRMVQVKGDRETFNQIEIRERPKRRPFFVRRVSEMPNFRVFVEVLEALGQPIEHKT